MIGLSLLVASYPQGKKIFNGVKTNIKMPKKFKLRGYKDYFKMPEISTMDDVVDLFQKLHHDRNVLVVTQHMKVAYQGCNVSRKYVDIDKASWWFDPDIGTTIKILDFDSFKEDSEVAEEIANAALESYSFSQFYSRVESVLWGENEKRFTKLYIPSSSAQYAYAKTGEILPKFHIVALCNREVTDSHWYGHVFESGVTDFDTTLAKNMTQPYFCMSPQTDIEMPFIYYRVDGELWDVSNEHSFYEYAQSGTKTKLATDEFIKNLSVNECRTPYIKNKMFSIEEKAKTQNKHYNPTYFMCAAAIANNMKPEEAISEDWGNLLSGSGRDKHIATNSVSPYNTLSTYSQRRIEDVELVMKEGQYIHFNEADTADVICLTSKTGTGKSTACFDLADNYESVLSVTHRVSLVEQNAVKMGGESFYAEKDLPEGDKVSSTIHSVWKLGSRLYDCVIIDEASQVLATMLNKGVLKDNQEIVINTMKHLLANAEVILLADADLDNITLEAFRDLINDSRSESNYELA